MNFSKSQRRVRRAGDPGGYQPNSPAHQLRQRKHRRHPWRWLVGGVLVLLVAGGLAAGGDRLDWRTFWDHAEASVAQPSKAQLNGELAAIIKANPQVSIGVAVTNLGNNAVETYGQTTPFTAASTTKLLTAVDFLHSTEQGTYSLNGSLGDSTANWQLQEMVNQSDDDSWALFNNLLGADQITAYADSIGLSSYEFDTNTITPADEAVLLEKLYEGKLLNFSDTKLLLSYMQHTNDEALIPAALPAGATVYHKYGELLTGSDNYVHDVAIISYKGQTFVLTIYTDRSGVLDIQNREQIIHEITQDVVQYET
jgi:beta-lactamase class A